MISVLKSYEALIFESQFQVTSNPNPLRYLCGKIKPTHKDMEIVSIERSTYEELLTNFNRFVEQLKEMASRGKEKRLGEWLDNQDVCQILNISPRTLQTLRDNGTLAYSQIERKVYYKPEDVKRILPLVEERRCAVSIKRKGGGEYE